MDCKASALLHVSRAALTNKLLMPKVELRTGDEGHYVKRLLICEESIVLWDACIGHYCIGVLLKEK